MSWIAVAGVAITAGTAAYGANQQSKAAKQAGSAKVKTVDPVMLGDPAQISPYDTLQQMFGANAGNYMNARMMQRSTNNANFREQQKYLNRIQPYFNELQRQIGSNALSAAQGQLPQDVSDQIVRESAQRGIQGGYGFGSQGARGGALGNNILRNLGLSSLDMMKYGNQLGMAANQQARGFLPNLTGLQDWLLNPQQALGISQFNTDAQNRFMLQNNQTMNAALGANTAAQNAAAQNAAQAQANATAAQGQMVASIGSSVGGMGMNYGLNAMGGTGGMTRQPTTSYSQPMDYTQVFPIA